MKYIKNGLLKANTKKERAKLFAVSKLINFLYTTRSHVKKVEKVIFTITVVVITVAVICPTRGS